MGWGEVAARSHARRLEQEGWLERTPMIRGQGAIFRATRSGVQIVGLSVTAATTPAPNSWAHDSACVWVAAWATLRGRRFLGPREVLHDPSWAGKLCWTDTSGAKRSGHRPDLIGIVDNCPIPIEVELASKSKTRLNAILGLHERWLATGRSHGLMYVCGDRLCAERVQQASRSHARVELNLRLELLDSMRVSVVGLERVAR